MDAQVQPNAYAVIQLKKNMLDRYGSYLQIDDPAVHYDGIAKQFLSHVSQKVYGQTAYRRKGRKLLPNFVTLEGDGVTKAYHLNIMVQRPQWICFSDFREMFHDTFKKQDWFKKGKDAFYLEERSGDSPAYSLKTGVDSVLWKSFTKA